MSIWHGAWEQRKGCFSSVSKKDETGIIPEFWQCYLDNVLLSVFCSSLWLGHEKCFATQISKEPLFWCALIVPGGVKTWLCCLPKRVGLSFCRSEVLAYVKFPWESSFWLQQDLSPRQENLLESLILPGCSPVLWFLLGRWWEQSVSIEGVDTPKWGNSFSFNHSLFTSKERWMGVGQVRK